MALSLPADPIVPGRLTRPEEVPAQVSDELLVAVLREGRPVGDEGTLDVDGVRCPLVHRGAGRPVLCVHGLGHDMWDFAPLFSSSIAGVEWRALDLPGFGLADKPAGGVTLALLEDALLEAARGCDEPPVIVASSLGGHVALLAALREPDAFRSLLLAAPGGLERAPDATAAMARAYYSYTAICARGDDEIVANSRRIFVGPHPAREALAARKLAVHRSARREQFARSFASVVDDVFRRPVAERVAEVRVPVQLVFGALDVVVPPTVGQRAAARYGLPLTVLDAVGHLPMVEAPQAFARELAAFLDDEDGQKGGS